MKPTIAFQTFGCKLNYSETSSIARQFREGGYEVVDFRDKAEIYVINTCSVTGTAEKKCKLAIKQAHKSNPQASIAVVGCFSQLKPSEIKKMEGVSFILGSTTKFELFDRLTGNREETTHLDTAEASNTLFIPSFSSGDRTRSFVKIQDGCDYFCSYCTIPFARGRSRSGSVSEVLDIVSDSLRHGIKEIILTGVNIGDFGKKTGETFYELLQALEEINRIPRIRISSIEPDLLSDDIIRFVSDSKRILPHFHIPLQSGSDHILKLMKRKYAASLFADRVLRIKELMPLACIAADVIVGFPGETEEDFRLTCELVETLPISYVHVFTFSSRPGTLAATLPYPVDSMIIKSRGHQLQQLSDIKKSRFYLENQGKTFNVLFESNNDQGIMHGFTENYIKVETPFDESMVNQIKRCRLIMPDIKGIYSVKIEE
ncbi:MAG: tRNA (N(6)-L-threonylcarbamoyladenosine(37)-C(2))-methylthiotransferase MtaB [Bacteroidetes bacterium]|nr:tRNA (N(6)-L-threonylcarbamoyladenosine(37)-C(2))-methylthiotransferase MtaB [Bacteroidota bacterium]